MTFKEYRFWCDSCKETTKHLCWDTDPVPPCATCGGPLEGFAAQNNKAPGVIGDEIDIMVPHGVCHEDGTPKRFRSKSALKQELAAKGLRECVRHVGQRGSDKSPFTTRWV